MSSSSCGVCEAVPSASLPSKVLRALGSPAFCRIFASSLGLLPLLRLRQLASAMPRRVEAAVRAAFSGEGRRIDEIFLDDFWHFFATQKDANLESERHAAIRLVIKDSPSLLRLEVSGSAAWQVDGYFALFGQPLCRINVDTVGLLFSGWQKDTAGLSLQSGNTLEKAGRHGAAGNACAALGRKFRKFLDPSDVAEVMELMNPSNLAMLSKLFPDGKYDVTLLQRQFATIEGPRTGSLQRGKPGDCYLSQDEGRVHLLKTQRGLDEEQVSMYSRKLQDAITSGSVSCPTALVFDFFTEGEIHDVLPTESPRCRGPGGRRQQFRAMTREGAWILLDGHHKVEAAVRLGCNLNFLVFSPCAEPYEPLAADDALASCITKQVCFPWLWPCGVPHAQWDTAHLCRHSPMLLSSSRSLPEDLLNALGCGCFSEEPWFPRWAYGLLAYYDGELGKSEMLSLLNKYLGEEHELFTKYFQVEMDDLPEELSSQFTSDPAFRHLIP